MKVIDNFDGRCEEGAKLLARIIDIPSAMALTSTAEINESALRCKFQEIAKSQMARQRKRLGPLSTEQEEAVESLLISMVNKISNRIISGMQRSRALSVADDARVWSEFLKSESP